MGRISHHAPAILLENPRGSCINRNTIFNWGQGTKMRSDVGEDAACQENSIRANSINYYERVDIESRGRDSVVSGNIGRAARADSPAQRSGSGCADRPNP